MNLPNKLTVFRMVLAPFFVAALIVPQSPHRYLAAFLLFAAASYTDHLDGKIARRDGLVTNFGKFMDPLADKILVISALVCFLQLGWTNVWFVLLVVAREFLVTSLRLVAADSGVVVAANRWGKAKTVSQIAAVLAVLLMQYLCAVLAPGNGETLAGCHLAGEVLIGVSVALTVVSGAVYLQQNWGLFRASR